MHDRGKNYKSREAALRDILERGAEVLFFLHPWYEGTQCDAERGSHYMIGINANHYEDVTFWGKRTEIESEWPVYRENVTEIENGEVVTEQMRIPLESIVRIYDVFGGRFYGWPVTAESVYLPKGENAFLEEILSGIDKRFGALAASLVEETIDIEEDADERADTANLCRMLDEMPDHYPHYEVLPVSNAEYVYDLKDGEEIDDEIDDEDFGFDGLKELSSRLGVEVPENLSVPNYETLMALEKQIAGTKKEKLLSLLSEGMVQLVIFASSEALTLPSHLMSSPMVRLNFSYRFNIPDFEVDDDGVRASLSFSGKPFFCDIPWECVVGMTMANEADAPYYTWFMGKEAVFEKSTFNMLVHQILSMFEEPES